MTPTKWDRRFLELAQLVATWSKDPTTKVGSVLVRPDRTVISVGYNGFPRDMPDEPTYYNHRDAKLSRVIHAEMNALLTARESLRGSALYSSFLPCDRCFVMLAQAGVEKFVAPRLAENDPKRTRWEPVFALTRLYAEEMGLLLYEVTL